MVRAQKDSYHLNLNSSSTILITKCLLYNLKKVLSPPHLHREIQLNPFSCLKGPLNNVWIGNLSSSSTSSNMWEKRGPGVCETSSETDNNFWAEPSEDPGFFSLTQTSFHYTKHFLSSLTLFILLHLWTYGDGFSLVTGKFLAFSDLCSWFCIDP